MTSWLFEPALYALLTSSAKPRRLAVPVELDRWADEGGRVAAAPVDTARPPVERMSRQQRRWLARRKV